jgi:hypothetical protein
MVQERSRVFYCRLPYVNYDIPGILKLFEKSVSWYAGQDELSDGDYGYKQVMLIFGFKYRRVLSSIQYKLGCNAQIPNNSLKIYQRYTDSKKRIPNGNLYTFGNIPKHFIRNQKKFCKDCNINYLVGSRHIHTRKHKENCYTILEDTINLVRTAFKNRIVTYHITNRNHITDVKLYLGELKCRVIQLINTWVETHSVIKVNMELYGVYLLPSSETVEVKSFNTKYSIITQNTDFEAFYNEYQDIIFGKALEFSESGSCWALAQLLYLELNICKYEQSGGG